MGDIGIDLAIAEQPEEVEEEKGVLDYSADIEAAFVEMSRVLEIITQENTAIANKTRGHAAQMQALNENPTVGSAAQKQKIALLVASDMNLCAKRFEDELPNFEDAINTIDDSFAGLMKITKITSTEEKDQIINFRTMLDGFLEGAETSIETFRSLRNVVSGLKGMSKDVNRASRRLAQALDGIIQILEKVEAFAIRAQALIDQWLENEGDSTSY